MAIVMPALPWCERVERLARTSSTGSEACHGGRDRSALRSCEPPATGAGLRAAAQPVRPADRGGGGGDAGGGVGGRRALLRHRALLWPWPERTAAGAVPAGRAPARRD